MNNYVPAYNIDLLPVLIALVLLSTIMLWIAIKNYNNLFVMMLIIPLTIASGWTVYTTVDKLLGYPVIDKLDDNAIYLHHTEGTESEWIYVWIYKPTDSRPKAIMVASSENNKKELHEAQARSKNGIPQTLKMNENRDGQTNGGELERYDFQMNDVNNLKDAEPSEAENRDGLPGGRDGNPLIRNPKIIKKQIGMIPAGLDSNSPMPTYPGAVQQIHQNLIPSGK